METIKPLQPSELPTIIAKYSPFFKEIRKRFFATLFLFAIASVAGFVFYEKIVRFLIAILSLRGVNIVFTSPFQFITLALSCGVATGVIVTVPFVIAQILSFLRPALRRKEFKMVVRFIPFSLILFIIGFIFGVIMMKWQIEIFIAQSISLGIGNILDISGLLTTVLLTSALMGVGFQFPTILLLLLRVGIIKQEKLTKLRLWIYLGSFVFALLLPPDSIIVDIFLSLPLIILFESTLFLNRILNWKRA